MNGRFVIATNVDTGAKTFELYDLLGKPTDTTGSSPGTGGNFQPVYEISTPYNEADLFDLNFVQDADVMTIVHPDYEPRTLSRTTATTFALATIDFNPVMQAPTSVVATPTGASAVVTYVYAVSAVDPDTFEESFVAEAASITNAIMPATGFFNTITWAAPASGPTPLRYNVYRKDDQFFGYIGQAEDLQFIDRGVTPDYSATPLIDDVPFAGADDYPGAVSYFQQRKVYGNTNNQPQNYWFSRIGTEDNMMRSLPLQDSDAIRGRIVSQQVNEIRHFVPLSGLLALTAGGEWLMNGEAVGVTPGSLSVLPQSYEGCAKARPEVTGNSVLYVQEAESRVHEIRYSWESSAYKSVDTSILAPHLVDGHRIIQIAYSKQPDSVLWAIRDDGALLGMTYVPAHEVRGWHRHDTDGLFKSCAVVKEDRRYPLYVVVQRTVNGATRNFIERMAPRIFDSHADFFGVDAGETYSGVAATTFTGLWHLEGKTVQILGDGARMPDQVVTGGSITIPTAVTKAHIGLQYIPEIEMLPAHFSAPGAGHGRAKSPTKAYLRVHRSADVRVGSILDDAIVFTPRTIEGYGSPAGLLSAEIDLTLLQGYSQDASVVVTQEGPHPLTLVAVVEKEDIGG